MHLPNRKIAKMRRGFFEELKAWRATALRRETDIEHNSMYDLNDHINKH